MQNKEHTQDKIERYLANQMSAEERLIFEKEQANNKELQEATILQTLIKDEFRYTFFS